MAQLRGAGAHTGVGGTEPREPAAHLPCKRAAGDAGGLEHLQDDIHPRRLLHMPRQVVAGRRGGGEQQLGRPGRGRGSGAGAGGGGRRCCHAPAPGGATGWLGGRRCFGGGAVKQGGVTGPCAGLRGSHRAQGQGQGPQARTDSPRGAKSSRGRGWGAGRHPTPRQRRGAAREDKLGHPAAGGSRMGNCDAPGRGASATGASSWRNPAGRRQHGEQSATHAQPNSSSCSVPMVLPVLQGRPASHNQSRQAIGTQARRSCHLAAATRHAAPPPHADRWQRVPTGGICQPTALIVWWLAGWLAQLLGRLARLPPGCAARWRSIPPQATGGTGAASKSLILLLWPSSSHTTRAAQPLSAPLTWLAPLGWQAPSWPCWRRMRVRACSGGGATRVRTAAVRVHCCDQQASSMP